jgi:hypothetical protein
MFTAGVMSQIPLSITNKIDLINHAPTENIKEVVMRKITAGAALLTDSFSSFILSPGLKNTGLNLNLLLSKEGVR